VGSTAALRYKWELLDQFDFRAMPVSGSHPCVARDERCFESLGDRHIRRVVGREIVAQSPDARDMRLVKVAYDAQVA